MFPNIHIALAAAFATALMPVAAFSDDFTRITTKQEYIKLVTGKRWHYADGYVLSKRNGKLTGEFGGEKLEGAWAWRGDMWCRTLQTHTKNTDCQILSINGNQLRSIREQGKGDTIIFTSK